MYVHEQLCNELWLTHPLSLYFLLSQDASVSLLHEEAQILSRAKRSVEQQLQTSKSHLQSLDTNRKSLKSKIGTTSRALEFDTHDFKVNYI